MPTPPINWCDKAAEYRQAYEALAMGKSKARVRFGDDEVEYSGANLKALKVLLDDAEAKCAASCAAGGTGVLDPGVTVSGRRQAIRARWL